MVVKVGLIIDVYIIIGLYAYGSKSVGPPYYILQNVYWLAVCWLAIRP